MSLLHNRSLKSLDLNLSDNKCSSKHASLVTDAFKKGHNLRSLTFCGYKWKPEAVVLLLRSLARKKQLDTLNLDNSCRPTNTGTEELSRALALTLKHTPSLKALSLNGGFDRVIRQFLIKMAKNKTLLELSIENNRLGDSGAYELAELLRVNPTLMLLKCDRNDIRVNGWKSIRLAFEMNRTLVHLPYPWNDLLSLGATGRQEMQIREILSDIQFHTHTNVGSQQVREYSFLPSNNIRPPSFEVEGLPQLPEHLLLLQREAQAQFNEKEHYWMANEPDDTENASTEPGAIEEWLDALDHDPNQKPSADWDNESFASTESATVSPLLARLAGNSPSPLRYSLGGSPNRPMPSPSLPRAAAPSSLVQAMLDTELTI